MFGIITVVACQSELPASDEPVTQNNHVLLITVDTLRADRIGAYGDPLAKTPNMDIWLLKASCSRGTRCCLTTVTQAY